MAEKMAEKATADRDGCLNVKRPPRSHVRLDLLRLFRLRNPGRTRPSLFIQDRSGPPSSNPAVNSERTSRTGTVLRGAIGQRVLNGRCKARIERD